jgi:hypothetical protein
MHRPKPVRRSRGAFLRIAGALIALLAASAAAQETSQPALPPPPALATPTAPATPGSLIAIVPVDSAATVTGALQVSGGRAMISTSGGSITSGEKTTEVVMPFRGTLRVCASSTVKLAADTSVPAGETPGIMMAIDHGAIEASFATARNSDILLTPDFRILIGGPGAADVKVRLGQRGDTCVDNAGKDAPYVLVTSVFDGGAYRVQAGQRVMFQHGSLQEVVDQEKEPCGCPEATKPGSNEFPVAQSAGLAPLEPAAPPPPAAAGEPARQKPGEPLVYQAPVAEPVPEVGVPPTSTVAQPSPVPAPASKQNKPGFFHRVGRFFRRIFGAE